MHIVWTLLIGFAAGFIAKLITRGKDPGGIVVTTIVGIAGAFVATYLGHYSGWYRAGESAGFIGAVVGSIILLVTYHYIWVIWER